MELVNLNVQMFLFCALSKIVKKKQIQENKLEKLRITRNPIMYSDTRLKNSMLAT